MSHCGMRLQACTVTTVVEHVLLACQVRCRMGTGPLSYSRVYRERDLCPRHRLCIVILLGLLGYLNTHCLHLILGCLFRLGVRRSEAIVLMQDTSMPLEEVTACKSGPAETDKRLLFRI
jgi:hypothetical protein